MGAATLKEVLKNYKNTTIIERLYLHVRWHLCPFEIIEKYVPKKGIIVDIGCGCGLLANVLHIKSNERKVLGIDASDMRLHLAKKSEQHNVVFEKKDVSKISIQSCDAIVMSDFLHHIPYEVQEKVIKEASTKLTKQGKLIILDIHKKPLWKFWFAQLTDNIMTTFDKTYYREKDEFKELLIKNEFSVMVKDVQEGLLLPDVLFVCARMEKEEKKI